MGERVGAELPAGRGPGASAEPCRSGETQSAPEKARPRIGPSLSKCSARTAPGMPGAWLIVHSAPIFVLVGTAGGIPAGRRDLVGG